MFCCEGPVDYSKLVFQETKKEEDRMGMIICCFQFLIILLTLMFLIVLPINIMVYMSFCFILIAFLVKLIVSKTKNIQFYFLPELEKNYVEIPYKIKSDAIDAKVTYHKECNPTKIMRDENNRTYLVYNTSSLQLFK